MRTKRKPIKNEIVRKMAILADNGRTRELNEAWDNIVAADRMTAGLITGKPMPRFARRHQGKWRQNRRAEDRKLKRELAQEGRLAR